MQFRNYELYVTEMKIKWCVYVLMYSRNKMQYNI